MNPSPRTNCQIYDGLESVQQRYSGFLIDAWGVLHDGVTPYPHALDCLQKLRETDKPVVILSNAARRHDAMAHELALVGIDDSLYFAVICSGELAWLLLKNPSVSDFGQRGFLLGPARSSSLCESLPVDFVDDIDCADFILNTGVPDAFGNPATTEPCEPLLQQALLRDLPMICANSDQVAVRGGQLGISAGALARRYVALGASRVIFHGKPQQAIYTAALQLLGGMARSDVLAIGDAFATDIRGGQDAGLDTWLIAGGIHEHELLPLSHQSIARTAPLDVSPTYASEFLKW